jgi:hypothetical protein
MQTEPFTYQANLQLYSLKVKAFEEIKASGVENNPDPN